MPRAKKTEDEVEIAEIDPRALSILKGDHYKPAPTVAKFHASAAFVRGIRGPVGSGKSSGCSSDILQKAAAQLPAPDGIRYSRFAVIRNTYGELKDTTIKTWLEWVPEEHFGKFNRAQGEMRHHIKIGDIDCEVLFRALDKPEDVKKVLSLELTGAWVNEAREVPKAIIDALGDRVGRYPAMRNGGCTWRGLMLDTNSPDNDHWWFKAAEEETPIGWEFFAQPPGLIQVNGKWVENPGAENLENLEPHYYATRAAGKREDYIRVYYANEYGFVQEGKLVFPEYSDTVHGAKSDFAIVPNRPVYIGIGLGQDNGAIFGQKKANGQWICLDELVPEQAGAVHFAELLSAKMKSDFPPGTQFKVFSKKPTKPDDDDAEAQRVLRSRQVPITPSRVGDIVQRRETVAGVLSRLIQGEPAVMIGQKCKVTRKALAGGYCYARIQASGEERYHDEPTKNRYRPMAEAMQDMMIGGGEDSFVFRSSKPKKLVYQPIGVV